MKTLCVVVCFCLPAFAWSCNCRPIPEQLDVAVEQAAARVSAVFWGRAVSILTNSSKGMDSYEFDVVGGVYKGEKASRFRIETPSSGAACGSLFSIGREYIVFAYRGQNQHLRTDVCTLTTDAQRADSRKLIKATGDYFAVEADGKMTATKP